jgi:hypothetical protein
MLRISPRFSIFSHVFFHDCGADWANFRIFAVAMKLSILIPTFDYDCTRLVEQLTGCVRESALGADAEIVVGDDASRDAAVVAALDALPALDAQLVRLVRAAPNLGRLPCATGWRTSAGEWLLLSTAMPACRRLSRCAAMWRRRARPTSSAAGCAIRR